MDYQVIYEAVLTPDDRGYYVEFPELDGAYTQGISLYEAAFNAVEVLKLIVAEYIEEQIELPTPVFNHTCSDGDILMVVPVELSKQDIEAMHYVSLAEAAEALGVGKPRVSHLIKSGKLKTLGEGTSRRISLDSINAVAQGKRSAGRPRIEQSKELATA